jgi:hypothetical protein
MYSTPPGSVSIVTKTARVLEPIKNLGEDPRKWIGCKSPCSIATIDTETRGLLYVSRVRERGWCKSFSPR